MRCLLVLAALSVVAGQSVPNLSDLECKIHESAVDFAARQLPWLDGRGLKTLSSALLLSDLCNSTSFAPETSPRKVPPHSDYHAMETAGSLVIYVAPEGHDANPGTEAQPLKTLHRARDVVRQKRPSASEKALIVLRKGTYYLGTTLELDERDSFLEITSYRGETAVLSGGRLLSVSWDKYQGGPILVANVTVPEQQPSVSQHYEEHNWGPAPRIFNALFVDGQRQIRARFPNGNPEELSGLCFSKADHPELGEACNSYTTAAGQYNGNLPGGSIVDKVSMGPNRGDSPTLGCPQCTQGPQTFEYTVYSPPAGHPVYNRGVLWDNTSYLSFWDDPLTRPAGALVAKSNMSPRHWQHPDTGVVHMFHQGLWGGWQYQLTNRTTDEKSGDEALLFGYGGYQEARGSGIGNQHFYVENIFEELDAEGEWFHDDVEGKLYWSSEVVASVLTTLVSIAGSSATSSVEDVVLSHLVLTETRTTFLDLYQVPSGGDWSIHRNGSVVVSNAEGCGVVDSVLDQVGGNGVVLNGHVANTTIARNEFDHVGDSAVVAVGDAQWIYGLEHSYPVGNVITQNFIHDIGVFGKQTSCFFQALTAETTLSDNVCFNGPRAGINFNDGFYGGHVIEGNLVFNMVRETGDHGPFNSWDRQPYITRNGVDDGFSPEQRGAPDGTSIIAAPSIITRNFMINGYNGVWTIDHDDGSQFFNDTSNLLVFGGCKNYLGHSKTCDHNLIVYPGIPERSSGNRRCQTDDNHVFANQYFHDNHCITHDGGTYTFGSCNATDLSTTVYQTWDNTFYAPNASFGEECGLASLSAWQQAGQDRGSTVQPAPDVATIVDMARRWLHMTSTEGGGEVGERESERGGERIVSGSGNWTFEYVASLVEEPPNILNGHGLCKDKQGRIYFTYQSSPVTSTTRALKRYDPDGTGGVYLGDVSLALGVPHGLRIEETDASSYLYHANNAATITKTDLEGGVIWRTNMSEWETSRPEFWPFKPTDAVVVPDSDVLLVADGYGRSYVHHFNKTDGRYLNVSFGGLGNSTTTPVTFNTPHGINIDPLTSAVVVSDRSNHRLVWTDQHGTWRGADTTTAPPGMGLPCNADMATSTSLPSLSEREVMAVPSLGKSYQGFGGGAVAVYAVDGWGRGAEVLSVVEVERLIGHLGHQHPHDAIFTESGDLVVCCWSGPSDGREFGPAKGTISYWKRTPQLN